MDSSPRGSSRFWMEALAHQIEGILIGFLILSILGTNSVLAESPGIISPYDTDIFVLRTIGLPSQESARIVPAYNQAGELRLVIAILDADDRIILEPVNLSEDLDPETLPSADYTPYQNQTLVQQEQDYNFDGQPDILINQGPMGCYGSTMYRYFLSTPDGKYRPHPGLDRLADLFCLIYPDPSEGLIVALDGRDNQRISTTWYQCNQTTCEKVKETVVELIDSEP